MLVFFPLGACLDEFINSQANYQGYRFVHFLRCHSFAVIHSMDRNCEIIIIITTVFDMYILKHLMI